MKNMLELWLEVVAWDKDGKVFHRENRPAQSPVKQFLQMLLSRMSYANTAGVVDTGGITRTLQVAGGSSLMATSLITNDAQGIVVGTNATAVDITDTKLVTQIAHGIGAGQMLYAAQSYDTAVTVADPNCAFATWRNFNNNSGGVITVRETGIYAQFTDSGSVQRLFCIVRDVPTAVAVPDGGGCYVKYTLKITE